MGDQAIQDNLRCVKDEDFDVTMLDNWLQTLFQDTEDHSFESIKDQLLEKTDLDLIFPNNNSFKPLDASEETLKN